MTELLTVQVVNQYKFVSILAEFRFLKVTRCSWRQEFQNQNETWIHLETNAFCLVLVPCLRNLKHWIPKMKRNNFRPCIRIRYINMMWAMKYPGYFNDVRVVHHCMLWSVALLFLTQQKLIKIKCCWSLILWNSIFLAGSLNDIWYWYNVWMSLTSPHHSFTLYSIWIPFVARHW